MKRKAIVQSCIAICAITVSGAIAYLKSKDGKLTQRLDVYISPDNLAAKYQANCVAERIVMLVSDRLELDLDKQEIVYVESMEPNMVFVVIKGEGYRHEMMYGLDTQYLCCDQYRCRT